MQWLMTCLVLLSFISTITAEWIWGNQSFNLFFYFMLFQLLNLSFNWKWPLRSSGTLIGTASTGKVALMNVQNIWFDEYNVMLQKYFFITSRYKKFLKCNISVQIINFSLTPFKLLLWYCDVVLSGRTCDKTILLMHNRLLYYSCLE